jgi:hypothetical protein
MGIVRKSGNANQPGHALAVRSRAASQGDAARTAVFAALDDLVEAGLATWHERWMNRIERRGIGGEAWLLDDSGVTRVR